MTVPLPPWRRVERAEDTRPPPRAWEVRDGVLWVPIDRDGYIEGRAPPRSPVVVDYDELSFGLSRRSR